MHTYILDVVGFIITIHVFSKNSENTIGWISPNITSNKLMNGSMNKFKICYQILKFVVINIKSLYNIKNYHSECDNIRNIVWTN